MKNFILAFSIILVSWFSACDTNKEVSKVATQDCQTMATVKDFTGLDACGLMLVLDNGDKLLPNSLSDPNFTLREGQRVKINYRVLEDMASACMAENAIVEITCIELVAGKPIIKECHDITDVTSVPWIDEVVKTNRIFMVKKYPFRTDGWAYVFENTEQTMLYDCQGTLLCEKPIQGGEPCLKRYLENEEGKVIFSIRQ